MKNYRKKGIESERPMRFLFDGVMPRFWPPRPNRFWTMALDPFRRWYTRSQWKVSEVAIDDIKEIYKKFGPKDGVLITPNHSHDADAHVLLEAARILKRRFFFMAAWQAFCGHWGIDGWLLQRMGAFSVDREGCDRRALHLATELLYNSNTLVIFPEGEIHRLNARLKPLLDGVAFIALNAQRKLEEKGSDSRIWILPAAIQYTLTEDSLAEMESAMKQLERRLFWSKPPPEASLQERIIRFGEIVLTVKEKEKLGKSFENECDLPGRIKNLIESLLVKPENEYLKKSPCAETIPLRVKALRRQLLAVWSDEKTDSQSRNKAREALDDVQLALQLFSYPGDYIKENPTIERMAETIEKFQEDIFGIARSIGKRKARLRFGEPIDMKKIVGSARSRILIANITDSLEETIRELMAKAG